MEKFEAAIICPLREEASALARLCTNIRQIDHNFSEATYLDGDKEIRLIIAQPLRKGATSAAALTASLVLKFSVPYICVIGICGSLGGAFERRAEVGDVIFADTVFHFSNMKLDGNDFDKSTRTILIKSDVLDLFSRYLSRGLMKKTRKKLHMSDSIYGGSTPTVKIGSFLSTDFVLKSSRYGSRIISAIVREINSLQPIAIEMEFAGVDEAVNLVSKDLPIFMIRGVNDKADENKYLQQANNRDAACHNAALIATDFISYIYKSQKAGHSNRNSSPSYRA